MPPIDPELLRRQLDEQLRRIVELAYQHYLTNVRALETVVRAQGEIEAAWPPLPLAGLLAGLAPAALPPAEPAPLALAAPAEPATPAPEPPPPPAPASPPARAAKRKRPKSEAYGTHDAILEVLDQLGEVFDKYDLFRALGFEPKRTNLYDALLKLKIDKVLAVDWYGLGNKPTRYRKVRAGEGE